MKLRHLIMICSCLTAVVAMPTSAKSGDFNEGPIITGHGKHAAVASASVDKSTHLKVAFDVPEAGEDGKVNRRFDSVARFINMHVAAGVPLQNIELAVVVHGSATLELLNETAYQERHQQANPNAALLKALMANNVKVIQCGQSAAANKVAPSQLIKGVQLELSAMTAHALLQQNAYTINPF